MPNYKPTDESQWQMMILNLEKLFAPNHPTTQLLQILNRLDLSAFHTKYQNDLGKGGSSAFPPERVLAVMIWHLLYGNTSMRQLERDLTYRADLIYLSGGLQMDHSTFSRFRKRHQDAFEKLFHDVVFLGVSSDMIDFETVCIDGTKIKANAGRDGFRTQSELEKLHHAVEESCQERLSEWDHSTIPNENEKVEKELLKLKRREEKLSAALQYLKDHPDRKKVHPTDVDCRWQRDSHGSFTVGYNAQAGVDSKSQMIVSKKVSSDNTDLQLGKSMILQTESIRLQSSTTNHTTASEPHYVMDSGYYSESNLKQMKDFDVYMPDCNLSHSMKKKGKKNDRASKEESNPVPSLRFRYDKGLDEFICPRGHTLQYYRDFTLKQQNYREYRRTGCSKCDLYNECTTQRNRKQLCVKPETLDTLQWKDYSKRVSHSLWGIHGKYTQEMRSKLCTEKGKEIYKMRQWVVEGVFGLLTNIRGVDTFRRRTLANVGQEWTERCIAHNLGKLLGFRWGEC